MLYKRALDLNHDNSLPTIKVHRYKGSYNYEMIKNHLILDYDEIVLNINGLIEQNDVNAALRYLDQKLQDSHKIPGCKIRSAKLDVQLHSITKVNDSFNEYKKTMGDATTSDLQREMALNKCLEDRKSIHHEVLKKESDAWSSVIANKDSKKLWSMIDWKGNYSRKKPTEHPSIEEFHGFFEDLYSCPDD